MSEIKRATLISFGADKGEDKKQKLVTKTVRIAFVLPESNEGTCPVYNYKEELAVAKKKDKSNKPVNNGRTPNGLDPFEDDDDDVRRIAQQMEAKYGMGPPAKKKQKGRKDDYADIGMGYDESDSFIDNTDGYDEIIPQDVTTLHGGFYINSGALEFKTDDEASSEVSSSSSSSSSDEEEDKPEKTSRKRVLETSESEGETETEKGKDGEKVPSSHNERKQQGLSNGVPLPKKKKLLTPEKIRQLKKGSAEDVRKKTVKDLLKEKREVINIASPPESTPVDKADKGDVVMKENKKPVSMHNVVDTIECVAKGSDNNNSIEDGKKDGVKETVNKDVTPAGTIDTGEIKTILVPSSEGENSRDSGQEQKTEIIQLPENLPEDISALITKLKETASKNTENKIFTTTVNKMLLSLERKCRCLGKHSKSRIYQHLGPFLKCRKETLIRRAKNLIIQDDMTKLKDLVTGLKSKIDEIMPPLLENYEKESQKIVQKKFSRESIEVEENKQLRMPKRRFSWTEEIKKQLKEIVTIRRRLFTLEGKSKEDLDIQMNLFLKSDIQILWPEGWMSMTALLKIYNNFGEKKAVPVNIKPPSTTPKEPAKPALDPSSIKDIPKTQPNTSKNNNIKSSKPDSVSTKDTQLSLPKGAKEMQKLATNSMLSIIPVTPRAPTPAESSKPVMNDLTINILENGRIPLPIEISKNSGISISPTVPSVVVKTSEESPIIRPIPDTIITPAEVVKPTEKPVKFPNPYSQTPENWSMKPIKPPTDHKIENIIKPSKPENLTKLKLDTPSPSPENLTKPKIIENIPKQPKPENLIKPKLDNVSKPKQELPNKPKPENLMKPKPENLCKPKPENLSKPKPENLSKPKPENLSKPKLENMSKPKVENLVKPKTDKIEQKRRESDDVIILDETLPEPEQRPPSVEKKPKENHVIDLTAHPELKRKPGPKSKTKYYDPSMIKPVKSASSIEASKHKQSHVADNLLQENLVDTEHYYSMKKSRSEPKDPRTAVPSMLPKGHNDGDDIQKVMEDLKVLQKMSAPSRSTHPTESVTSSPVSVISFNKNYTPKSTSSNLTTPPKVEPKPEYSLGFQEAFQRQFLNELKNSLSAGQNTPTSSKGFNSAHSSSTVSHPEKYYMNANNNYAQQNASKYKTNYTAQQQGTFNLMDDMLANFISEYAYPKTANHKQKPQK